MEIVDYLLARKKAGGGSDVTIEQLSVTENGTYSEQGIAYSPVVVNVPAPANSYQLKNLPSGTASTIDDGTDLPMPSLKVGIEPVQDLHGYDHPWAGGAGANELNPDSIKATISAISGSSEGSDVDGNYVIIPRNASINNVILYSDFTENTQYTIFFKVKPTGETRTNIRVYYTDNTSDNIASSRDGVLENSVYVTNASKSVSRIELGFWYLVTTKVYYDSWGIMQGSHTKSEFEPYSNICPISGWTAANVMRSGKNLFDKNSMESGLYDDANFTVIQTSSTVYRSFKRFLKAGTYTFSASKDIRILRNVIDGVYNSLQSDLPKTFTLTKDGIVGFSFRNKDDSDWDTTTNCQIEYGTTATTYEPYNGTTYTIQFTDGTNPLTVYGGTLDVTTGELVVDRAEVDLGTFNWTTSNHRFNTIVPLSNAISRQLGICSIYKSDYGASSRMVDKSICVTNGDGFVYIYDTSKEDDVTEFKTAMSGVQLVYELAEPITYQLTPAQVRTLVGTNNIWADTGNIIEGKYFKSLV